MVTFLKDAITNFSTTDVEWGTYMESEGWTNSLNIALNKVNDVIMQDLHYLVNESNKFHPIKIIDQIGVQLKKTLQTSMLNPKGSC